VRTDGGLPVRQFAGAESLGTAGRANVEGSGFKDSIHPPISTELSRNRSKSNKTQLHKVHLHSVANLKNHLAAERPGSTPGLVIARNCDHFFFHLASDGQCI
jgi:hypothetical protein